MTCFRTRLWWLKLRLLDSVGVGRGVRETAALGALWRRHSTAGSAGAVASLSRLGQSSDAPSARARLCEGDYKKDRQVGGLLLKVRTHLDPICSSVELERPTDSTSEELAVQRPFHRFPEEVRVTQGQRRPRTRPP